jgi:tripartite-type tricarboxylate transporter receptor subunit TctC
VLSTNAQKPFKTLAEVVAAAKTKPGTLEQISLGLNRRDSQRPANEGVSCP